ncbi:MAG: hypothetical protein AAB468_02705 [Patescibacteria group bacterium]
MLGRVEKMREILGLAIFLAAAGIWSEVQPSSSDTIRGHALSRFDLVLKLQTAYDQLASTLAKDESNVAAVWGKMILQSRAIYWCGENGGSYLVECVRTDDSGIKDNLAINAQTYMVESWQTDYPQGISLKRTYSYLTDVD